MQFDHVTPTLYSELYVNQLLHSGILLLYNLVLVFTPSLIHYLELLSALRNAK